MFYNIITKCLPLGTDNAPPVVVAVPVPTWFDLHVHLMGYFLNVALYFFPNIFLYISLLFVFSNFFIVYCILFVLKNM